MKRYFALRERWDSRIRKEPQSWEQERSQYIQMLQRGHIEDVLSFWLLICPCFVLCSFYKKGFWFFPTNVRSQNKLCVIFVRSFPYWTRILVFWAIFGGTGLFDRLVFGAFGDVQKCSALEEDVLIDASLRMSPIPSGSFFMGALQGDKDAFADEIPQHLVSFTKDLEMCRYLCTQVLYERVMGKACCAFQGVSLPIEEVSWCQAVVFCNKLSALHGLEPAYVIPKQMFTLLSEEIDDIEDEDHPIHLCSQKVQWNKEANGYRSPTEAEWEYCARADEEHFFSGSNTADEVSWSKENSDGTTQPVAQKKPNKWRLNDMSGLLWEWCWDMVLLDTDADTFYDESLYQRQPCVDPTGPVLSIRRMTRGGSWFYWDRTTRVSIRYANEAGMGKDILGFRMVRNRTQK